MAEDLIFEMGKYPATLPGDRRYARNHMWCQEVAPGRHRFGFTSYAVRLMQDVYFLDWSVDAGTVVALKQQVGNIESSKAVSDLFAPVAGTLVAFNAELLKDPSGINVDCYGVGWLFEMLTDAAGTMTTEGYHAHLTNGWTRTQQMLKGQMG